MKKKNIKKPEFLSYLTAALVPALILAFLINLAGYYYADMLARESMTITANFPSTQEKNALIDLYFEDRDEEAEREYQEMLSTIYTRYSFDCYDYYELYDGSDQIFSTKISGFAIVDKKCYRLTDDPEFQKKYLETFGDIQVGDMDYWRAVVASTVVISFDENGDPAVSLLNLGYRSLMLSCPDGTYTPTVIEDIYIDRDNMVFYPGKVEYSDLKENSQTVDLTPVNTEGLEHIVRDDLTAGLNFTSFLNHPHSDNGIVSDDTYELTTEEGNTLTLRHVSYKIPSFFSLFPVQSILCWILVTAVCCLCAYFVARYRYGKVKAMYDMIEYRRTTSNAMAHDLKTPLAILSAYADNMEEEQDPEKIREYSAKIRENVTSANRMLEDILDFSRSESGAGSSTKENVSLSCLISSSLDRYSAIFNEHGITIDKGGKDLALVTDKKLLSQAVDNLISNCARHATEKTAVSIEIKDDCLIIRNRTDLKTGDVNELLKPYVKGSSSRGDTGTGLGLSVAKNDLEILGYKLQIDLKDQIFTALVKFR
ncbi:MAG: HAMP domain-containing histidine kinase [Clostridiales bacterium]|nr:HAMP domain-containing histidine kinase [Clostridiales bacterium]